MQNSLSFIFQVKDHIMKRAILKSQTMFAIKVVDWQCPRFVHLRWLINWSNAGTMIQTTDQPLTLC